MEKKDIRTYEKEELAGLIGRNADAVILVDAAQISFDRMDRALYQAKSDGRDCVRAM